MSYKAIINVPQIHLGNSPASDCGGVFRHVVSSVISDYIASADFIDGPHGRTFHESVLYMNNHYLRRVELFGRLLAMFVFFHDELPWPFQLDFAIFMIPYSKALEHPCVHGGRYIGGAVGKTMSYLEKSPDAATPCTALPSEIADLFVMEPPSVRRAWLTRLQSQNQDQDRLGCREQIYQKFHIGFERISIIVKFARGLNCLGLFNGLAQLHMPTPALSRWLQHSGKLTPALFRSLLEIKTDTAAPAPQAKGKQMSIVFRDWLDSKYATEDMLTWLHRELVGTEVSCGKLIEVDFYTGDDSYIGFHTCFPRLSLNVQWLETLDSEEQTANDEVHAFDMLLRQERTASTKVLFTIA